MARPAYGGRRTCESCRSIDVRRWHRNGALYVGHHFSCSWTWDGKPSGRVDVRTETDAVVLIYRPPGPGAAEWQPFEQRVAITWTACHFGGRAGLGSYARSTPVVDIAAGASRCCTRSADYSAAGSAAAWPMQVSRRGQCFADLRWPKRFARSLEEAPTYSKRFRTNRKACTGQLMIGCDIATHVVNKA
jgi:hypothetical protein